jgi:hypothetical protein
VREQLSQGDPRPVRNKAGEPTLDRVTESQPVFGDELEYDNRDERLGDAACPKPIVGAQRHAAVKHGKPSRCLAPGRTIIDKHQRTRASRINDRDQQRSRRIARRSPVPGNQHCADDRHYDQCERRDPDPPHGSSLFPFRS